MSLSDRIRAARVVLLVCFFSAACGEPGAPGEFTGTWVRDVGNQSRSLVSIWKEGDGYRMAVNRSDVRGHTLRCGRTGGCDYYNGDAPYFRLEFEVRDPGEGDTLFVDAVGGPLPGKQATPIEWVDRLALSPDGKTLEATRVELNGKRRNDPPRRFRKKSNAPFR